MFLIFIYHRLTSNLPNSNIIQNKWTANWITIYKSYSKFGAKVTAAAGSRHYVTNDTASVEKTSGNNGDRGHEHQHRKGKSSKCRKIRKSWSWKAGAGWTILSMLDWWLIAAGGWLTWRGLFLKWTPIGIGLVAAAHWHLRNQECDRKGLPRTASKWMVSVDWNKLFFSPAKHSFINRNFCFLSFSSTIFCFLQIQTDVYCSLPLRLMSRTWGWLADCRIPIPMRPIVYGAYSTAFGVNINEASNPNLKWVVAAYQFELFSHFFLFFFCRHCLPILNRFACFLEASGSCFYRFRYEREMTSDRVTNRNRCIAQWSLLKAFQIIQSHPSTILYP